MTQRRRKVDAQTRVQAEGAFELLEEAEGVFERVLKAASHRHWLRKLQGDSEALRAFVVARERLQKLQRRAPHPSVRQLLADVAKSQERAAERLIDLADSLSGESHRDPSVAAEALWHLITPPQMEVKTNEHFISKGVLRVPGSRRWLLTTRRFAIEGPGNESGEVLLESLEPGDIEYRSITQVTLHGDRVLELRGVGARSVAARVDVHRRRAFRHPQSKEINVLNAERRQEKGHRAIDSGVMAMFHRWAAYIPDHAYLEAIAVISASEPPERLPAWWARANLMRHTTPQALRRLEARPPEGVVIFRGDETAYQRFELDDPESSYKFYALHKPGALVEVSFERGKP